MKQKNLAVELLNRLLKGSIKTFSRQNLVQSKKFSELLEAAIRKYQNRAIETTQVIMELQCQSQERHIIKDLYYTFPAYTILSYKTLNYTWIKLLILLLSKAFLISFSISSAVHNINFKFG